LIVKNAMRILALLTDAFGGYGGIAQFNRDLLSAFSALDEVRSVVALVRLTPDELGVIPTKIAQQAPKFNRILYSAAAIAEAIKLRPDIVFCGHLYHAPLASLLSRITGARLICQLHGTEVWTDLSRQLVKALDDCDQVWCVSRDTKRRVDMQSKRAVPNTHVLANTVGDQFDSGDRKAARQKFSIGDQKAIVTVARLDGREGYKGHDNIIALLAGLQKPDRRVDYYVAGSGPDEARLRQLAQTHEVTDRVHFLGKVPFEDLPDIYRAADLFALPSTGEGFGIVFLEAMACGTPSIGLSVGGSPDALGDGDLGACVSEADFPEALAAALDQPRLDAEQLSKVIHERFGKATFNTRVQQLLTHVS
jgi:phosphatidyl-myo-inositol dimannoside synthase